MMLAKRLRTLVEEGIAQGGKPWEIEAQFRLAVKLDSVQATNWSEIASDPAGSPNLQISAVDEFGSPIFPINSYGGQFPIDATIRILKADPKNLVFITTQGFRDWLELQVDWPSTCISIRVFSEFEAFSSRGCYFASAESEPTLVVNATDSLSWSSPREFVHSTAATPLVPSNVRPWTLVGKIASSRASSIFADVASRRMLVSLSSKCGIVDDRVVVSLSGVRKIQRTLLADEISDECAMVLSRTVEWVYTASRDASVRHTFAENALARCWDLVPSVQLTAEDLSDVQVEAEAAYNFHLEEAGEQTVKLLGELRKTLADDAAKLAQQTRDLVSTLWRDMIIVFTALSARIVLVLSGNAAAATAPEVEWGLYFTAALIVLSGLSSLGISEYFQRSSALTLKSWREELYRFVPERLWQKLASDPLRRVNGGYTVSKLFAIAVYAAAVWVVVHEAHAVRDARLARIGSAIDSSREPSE